MKSKLLFLIFTIFTLVSCTTTQNQAESKKNESASIANKSESPEKKPVKVTPSPKKSNKIDLYKNIPKAQEFYNSNPDGPFQMRDGRLDSIILGDWNADTYCFHSLEIGDSQAVIAEKLKPEFELAYRLSATVKGLIYKDKKDPNFYLEIDLDDQNCVYLILYKYDYVYSLDSSGV